MENKMEKQFIILEDNVRNTFGSVVWSHKIQEKQADIYFKKYKKLETAKVISSSLTSVGIVSLMFTDQFLIKIISALVSFVTIFVSAFFKSFNLENMIRTHKITANKLLEIRDKLKLLILKINLKQLDISTLMQEYETIVKTLDYIYMEAPSTTDEAVIKANIALNIKNDNLFTEEEIDNNLPRTLKRR